MKGIAIKKIFGATSEYAGDLYKNASYIECAECYAKLLDLGDPHASKTYYQAKKKADKAIALAKKVDGGGECNQYGMDIVNLVGAFVEKAERLWKLKKELYEEKLEME